MTPEEHAKSEAAAAANEAAELAIEAMRASIGEIVKLRAVLSSALDYVRDRRRLAIHASRGASHHDPQSPADGAVIAMLIADAQAEGLTEAARYWFRVAARARFRVGRPS